MTPFYYFIIFFLLSTACSSYNFKDIRQDEKTKNIQSLISCLLKNQSPYIRTQCAQSLGRLANQKAANALIKALSDPDWGVRYYASESLAKIKYQDSIQALQKQLLIEQDEQVIASINKSLSLLNKK